MGSSYDEDLIDNAFFQTLKKDYTDLFYKVILEGCVICVPRAGSLPTYSITLDDILGHIIIPNDEMPESHFQTLSGKDVKISNRVVTLEYDYECQINTQLLFEETYYTEDLLKYKVLCIEHPLEPKPEGYGSGLLELRTLRDCMDFLNMNSEGKNITELLDQIIETFLANKEALKNASIQTLKDLTAGLYKNGMQIAFKDRRLREKAYLNMHTLRSLKLSVETYVHHGIYKQLFKYICACTSHEDSKLNKIIRNSMDLELRDLEVRAEFHDLIPNARAELGKLNGYSTVLGKLTCLKKMMTVIAKDPESGGLLAADDLLPIIIYLVLKTTIANWLAHLTYLQNFHFSIVPDNGGDEDEFLVTTLEAAIEHIKSGIFIGPSCPENARYATQKRFCAQIPKDGSTALSNLFEQAAKGNLKEVRRILENTESSLNYSDLDLCHPLCSCDKCSGVVKNKEKNTNPSIHSTDDKGLTVFHVANMYGQPAVIDYLLSLNPDLEVRDHNGRSPLHHAAYRGHQHALLFLTQAGADVNAPDNQLNTPLHLCCSNGHTACVKALIYHCEQEGIRLWINVQNSDGDTPLHHASKWGYFTIVRTLVENNADPSIVNRRKLSSFQVSNNSKISEILSQASPKFKCGMKSKAVNFDFLDECPEKRLVAGELPTSSQMTRRVDKMLKAISCGDINLACFYLGLNPLHSIKHCHPLCSCADCSNKGKETNSAVEKVKVNMCNSEGTTALHVAAFHGRLDLAKLLVKNGALLDVQTRSQLATPLMIAAQQQRMQVAKFLLESGCKVNLQDHKGNSALHYACLQSSKRMVEIILLYEPKLSLRNRSGRTALQEAQNKMALGIANMISSASQQ